MSFILDIALVGIVFLTVFVYYKRGFVRAVLGFGKVLLSLICAVLFGKMVGGLLAEKFFDARLTDSVYKTLSGLYEAGSETFDLSRLAEKIPSSLRTLAERCGADIDSVASGGAGDTAASAERLREISAGIASPISTVISNLLGCVLVFVTAYLLFLLGSFILESVAELPVLRTFNKILGLCLGVVCAIVFAFIFVFVSEAVIYWIIASGDESAALEIINKTLIYKLLCRVGV